MAVEMERHVGFPAQDKATGDGVSRTSVLYIASWDKRDKRGKRGKRGKRMGFGLMQRLLLSWCTDKRSGNMTGARRHVIPDWSRYL
jgi:hypothetical protein